VETLSERLYRVEFQNGHRILAHWPRGVRGVLRGACSVSERTTQHAVRPALKPGEKVIVGMSPFDFSRGRIVS